MIIKNGVKLTLCVAMLLAAPLIHSYGKIKWTCINHENWNGRRTVSCEASCPVSGDIAPSNAKLTSNSPSPGSNYRFWGTCGKSPFGGPCGARVAVPLNNNLEECDNEDEEPPPGG